MDIYAPLIRYWATQSGMREPDTSDLLQDVFAVLLKQLPLFEYDADRSFRAWLKRIVLNVWRAHIRRRRFDCLAESQEPTVDDPAEDYWEQEFTSQLIRQALTIMKRDFAETTWKACWDVVVEGHAAVDVGKRLGITTGAVYAARFRVLARLRSELNGCLD